MENDAKLVEISDKDYQERQVRERDRFLCQYCGKAGEHYTRIIPDGPYASNNLVFLCHFHNDWLDPAKADSVEMKARLRELAHRLRDKPKTGGLLRHLFMWPAAGEQSVVVIGGIRHFAGQEHILTSTAHPKRPYLKVDVDDIGLLRVNACFEDAQGNEFMSITESELEVATSAVRDIVIDQHGFSLTHTDCKINITLCQQDNLELWLTGSVYLNGKYTQL